MKNYFKKHYPLLLSFWTPFFIMLGYFIYRGFYPFGTSSVLTVDLGQQYVDFFAYFRHTILHAPSDFFYSFSKALGGQMLGEYAYYLLSPFNLIFLLFPGKYLTAGCLVVLLLKYGCAGYTFGRLLNKNLKINGLLVPTLATSYALMGWLIANQLNMLWLDAPIFLPLIISALYKLLSTKKSTGYVLFLAAMIFINYYMAYMICLFLALFFIWYQTEYFSNKKQLLKQTWLFASRSLLAIGVASALLIPTLYSLTTSKGQYTETNLSFKFEYLPFKMLSKFVIGAFNFDQMPEGYPNLFIGSLALFGFILYFLNRQIKRRSKIAAGLISLFLAISMCFEPLDLLWHGMQFPVWYPYRFSFVVSFWMIFLAAIALKKSNLALKNWQTLIILGLVSATLVYVYLDRKDLDYISNPTLLFTALFNVLVLLLLTLKKSEVHRLLTPFTLYLVVCLELLANTAYSLNNISYLTQEEFETPSTALTTDATTLSQLDTSFYRTAQLYARTKDDGLAQNLNTGSYFSSALEKSIPDFYGQIGQPDGDNYVGYYNGTLISDSLLNVKYLLQAKQTAELTSGQSDTALKAVSFRPDVSLYQLQTQTNKTRIYQNPYAVGLGYAANKALKNVKVLYNQPLTYQTNWLNAATGSAASTKYFYASNFNEVVFENTGKQVNLTGSYFKKTDLSKDAQIIFKFTPTTNDSYYLTLGSNLSGDYATWYNGTSEYSLYDTFRHTVVLNPATSEKGQEQIITVKFKKNTLWLDSFVLYRMDNKLVEQKLKQLQKSSWKITFYNSRKLTGTINITKKNQIFATTIPYSKGWHATVDGKSVKTYKIQDTFIGFNIGKGKHTVTLTFTPPGLWLGCIISLISLGITLLLYLQQRKRQK
ncbi:MAG: YfhO family protein [Lactobacillus sp.]|nr:YfhO family protein [Lactobacillus sp.]